MISITLDTDWVKPVILKDTMDLLDEYGQKATAFCTSPYPEELLEGHEKAIHPNFHNRELNEQEHIENLLDLYPRARGVRAHTLYLHGRLLTETYPKMGLEYTSDYMMLYQEDIKPFQVLGLWQFPIYFADVSWLRDLAQNKAPKLQSLDLTKDSLKVFCFHPIHVYANTCSIDFYNQIKAHYQEPEKLYELRNREKFGVRDLLKQLLKKMKTQNLKSQTLRSILEAQKQTSETL